MKALIFFFLVAVSGGSMAQTSAAPSIGTKTLYQPLQQNFCPVPAGYKPIFVNFVGRHGARHLTKDVKSTFTYGFLRSADSLHMLTEAGLRLKANVQNLAKVEESNFGSISKIGVSELEGIAERMYENQKNVFSSKPVKISVATTKKGRTKESAEAFLSGLKAVDSLILDSNISYNYADDVRLRFYDFPKAYLDFEDEGSWQKYYTELARKEDLGAIAKRVLKPLFKPSLKISSGEALELVDDLYGFYTIGAAIENEVEDFHFAAGETNFKKYFTLAELKSLSSLSDLEDFLKKGPGTDKNGIQVKIAAPLLLDFITSADSALVNHQPRLNLRFAHAETIAPFAAILDLDGASEPTKDVFNFTKVWEAQKIIPFSANIQWIFYKKKDNPNFLVKILLNEKEATIKGLQTKALPYYDWQDVRNFYAKKLKDLGVDEKTDIIKFLSEVR